MENVDGILNEKQKAKVQWKKQNCDELAAAWSCCAGSQYRAGEIGAVNCYHCSVSSLFMSLTDLFL